MGRQANVQRPMSLVTAHTRRTGTLKEAEVQNSLESQEHEYKKALIILLLGDGDYLSSPLSPSFTQEIKISTFLPFLYPTPKA